METIVLVVHLLLALGITGLVLIQRSDGGLGLSGSGGMGSAAGAAQTANILTRSTAILATCFILTSLTLSIMAGRDGSLLDSGTDAIIQAGVGTDEAVDLEQAAKKAASDASEDMQKDDETQNNAPAIPTAE